jgi:hypothetical protein
MIQRDFTGRRGGGKLCAAEIPEIATQVSEDTRNRSFASIIQKRPSTWQLGCFRPLFAGIAGISRPKPLKNHGGILGIPLLESRNTRKT